MALDNQKNTPFTNMFASVDDAIAFCGRISTLADALCGQVPTPATQSSMPPQGTVKPPVFLLLDDKALQLAEAIAGAGANLDRIGAMLP